MKPIVGQKGLPEIGPDITPVVGLFVNAPAPRPPASEMRAVKISVSELARAWCMWLGWRSENMALALRELADERGWED